MCINSKVSIQIEDSGLLISLVHCQCHVLNEALHDATLLHATWRFWLLSFLVGALWICLPNFDQNLKDLWLIKPSCIVERRVTILIPHIDIRVARQQEAGATLVAMLCGYHERCPAILVLGVKIGTLIRNVSADFCSTILGCYMNWTLTIKVRRLRAGTGIGEDGLNFLVLGSESREDGLYSSSRLG